MKQSLQTLTLGCSKNRVDTEHMLARLKDSFEILPEDHEGKADILLVNTCGFIGDAKEESIQAVLLGAERKKKGEVGKLLVSGCLSQRYMDSLPELIPEVDGWYGARDLAPIVKDLGGNAEALSMRERFLMPGRNSFAYLKISEGCDRRCSFCAIPFIRGAHKSVPMEALVKEAESLASAGVKELVLIAQDTTYYGLDLYRRRALAGLLRKLSQVEGIERLRIHYSYPADFPEDVLEEMASNPKVCKYLDIPLQHVSDKVLSNMRRHVDGEWTRTLVRTIREKVPGIVLRTTLIVGHPGEGEREFRELLDFVRECRFERLGAFKYSEEEGTYGASAFKDTVSEKVKQERLSELMSLQSGISFAYNQSRVGSCVRVLVDDFSGGVFVCRSEFESPEVDGEVLVKYDKEAMGTDNPEALIGSLMDVRIVGADEYDIIGEYLG